MSGKSRMQSALKWFGPFIGLILVLTIFSLMPEVQDRFLRISNLKSVAIRIATHCNK